MKKKILILTASILIIIALVVTVLFIRSNNSKEVSEAKTENTTNQSATEGKTTVEYISGNKSISTFNDSLNKAGLIAKIDAAGPFTVFAPSNDAFKNMPEGYNQILFDESKPQTLNNVLSYHIAEAKIDSTNMTNGQKIKTITGQELLVELKDNNIYITDAKGTKVVVKKANIITSNGVVYIIDGVLLPQ